MARVIVILTLLFLITGAIFGLTRKPAGQQAGIDAEARATLPLATGADPADGTKPGAPAASAQDLVTGLVAGAAPAFSSVGVDHRGRASFTGTASPGDRVFVVHDTKVLGKAQAGKDGSWTIEFRVPQVRESYDLKVESRRGGETVEGPQRALVSPPETSGGLPRITLEGLEKPAAEPAAETAAAEAPSQEAAAEPEVGIIIEKVESDGNGMASLRGKADPGATIKVQIEGKEAASTQVAADGAWALTVSNATDQAVKSARVVLQNAQGRELDFSEFPLNLPAVVKAPSQPVPTASDKPASPATVASASSKAPRAGGYYVKVRKGDSLWKLARKHYGDGKKWTRILKANRKRLADPDLIRPGRRLYLP